MTKTSSLQFVIDDIPMDNLDEFHVLMIQFKTKSGCRWQYKHGKSITRALHDVPLED